MCFLHLFIYLFIQSSFELPSPRSMLSTVQVKYNITSFVMQNVYEGVLCTPKKQTPTQCLISFAMFNVKWAVFRKYLF